MDITTIKTNRLFLAGLLAFVLLFATQVSIVAYEFDGGWNPVKTIGGYEILTIGNPAYDTSLNIGAQPIISTNPVTVTSDEWQTSATLSGNLADLGVMANVYTHFDYGGSSYGYSTSEVTKNSAGTVTDTISDFDRGIELHSRIVARAGDVYVYGDDTIASSSLRTKDILLMWVPHIFLGIIIALVIIFLLWGGRVYYRTGDTKELGKYLLLSVVTLIAGLVIFAILWNLLPEGLGV